MRLQYILPDLAQYMSQYPIHRYTHVAFTHLLNVAYYGFFMSLFVYQALNPNISDHIWKLFFNLGTSGLWTALILQKTRKWRRYMWTRYLMPLSHMPLYINHDDEALREYVKHYLEHGCPPPRGSKKDEALT